MIDIKVPDELIESQYEYAGEAGRAFIAALPARVAEFVDRWELKVVGDSMYGMAALVLPVLRADGSDAVVKFQVLDEETEGEPVALRVWNGDGAVRLLDYDDATGTMLLERARDGQELSEYAETGRAETRKAVVLLAELLARLTAVPAPPGMRTLGDIAGQMLDDTPAALKAIPDLGERALIGRCADAVREVVGEPGDRMLHWDLHFDNVLASDREPWLAIDPKPLAGDPGFDLWPALDNLFEADEVCWRFDAMTEVLGLDRERARAWTLGRVLQNALWDVEDGRALTPDHLEVARRLLAR
ncbi:aminoglycoside phosphotransferase family protein [Streptomyces flavofungini]|uniref:Hydroxyurea phosphotransferase n=1 Tax=Streptomyces flavofungini TaxID=68200 RepID=A0ABS0X197_9ACTN|nr:aminoglycoside phosphotransferase family protein [Streptomyces flavofungini]MBJ3806930.1 hydroxyurea phosphotransferase [Streptomyces flavofungini]GHC59618.1 hydroxyurea phosphotransferase [Streptomyces flavofungini]